MKHAMADRTVRVLRMDKSDLMKTVGTGARAARAQARLTQAEVAEQLGIKTEVYGRLERGHMLPSVETLWKLCAALRVPADALLGSPGSNDLGTGMLTKTPVASRPAPRARAPLAR